MTIKKRGSKHSETALPDGGFVPVTGLNYGLDGFDFDTDYGDGVEDGAALPEGPIPGFGEWVDLKSL